jgi:hypothetical protein
LRQKRRIAVLRHSLTTGAWNMQRGCAALGTCSAAALRALFRQEERKHSFEERSENLFSIWLYFRSTHLCSISCAPMSKSFLFLL